MNVSGMMFDVPGYPLQPACDASAAFTQVACRTPNGRFSAPGTETGRRLIRPLAAVQGRAGGAVKEIRAGADRQVGRRAIASASAWARGTIVSR